MDKQMMISIIVLILVIDLFIVFLFVQYKQGKIDENPFGAVLLKERTILYYSIFRWKNKKVNQSADGLFAIHKNSTYFWLFIALVHEQIIEAIVFHVYLKKVDPAFAYLFTGLHFYSILYILGDYNWVRNTPILVKGNTVKMKIGARRDLSFQISDIKVIQKAKLKHDKNGSIIHEQGVYHATAFPRMLTILFGISDELKHEVIFNEPLSYKGYFGGKRQVTKALIYIEESNELAALLEKKLKEYEEAQTVGS